MFKRITSAAFLSILMLCAVSVEAQIFSRDLFSLDTAAKKPTLDTIRVLLLVCDTSYGMQPTGLLAIVNDTLKADSAYRQPKLNVWYEWGYDVRYKYCCVNGNTSNLAYYQAVPYYEHYLYLNDKKVAFKPSIVVWQTVAK